MSAPSASETILPQSGQHRFRAGFVRFAVALTRALAARRDVLKLTALDDRALKDIGLLRADVEGALAGSMLRDPSVSLVVKACERRADVRAAMRAKVKAQEKDAQANPISDNPAPRIAA